MKGSRTSTSSSTSSHAIKGGVSSTVESSVTRLLVSTKHLLESLTQWTRQEVDDRFVSDAYVKLGNDFRAAIRAFSNANVDISDIGDVPKALRIVLESALSEPPTQESLDRYLPRIRNIIVNLLQNLKRKQSQIKEVAESATYETKDRVIEQVEGNLKTTKDVPAMILHGNETSGSDGKENFVGKTKSHIFMGGPDETEKGDALRQLQESKVISRRASKRFSAYQYAKLANTTKPSLPSMKKPEEMTPSTATSEEGRSVNSGITAYLTIGDRTKKVILSQPITMASLRLSFVENFAYSPGTTIFPDIYVQIKDVSYELEDHLIKSDVVDGVSLKLMEHPVVFSSPDELSSKIDLLGEQLAVFLATVKEDFNSVKDRVDQVAQQPRNVQGATNSGEASRFNKDLESISRELKALKHVQQSHRDKVSLVLESSNQITSKLKESVMRQSGVSGRQYMESSYGKLSRDSDFLLTKVDDLSDMMEALRKDVAQRGVRVGQKQLMNATNEIISARNALHLLREFIEKEKPTWKKIWEQELDKVCEEQQFLTLQDDLTSDLSEDIKKIEETLDLIDKCSRQQGKMMSSKRTDLAARINFPDRVESLHGLKDAVLSEVASVIPDHSSRLEAIEKAERIRNKERELMAGDQFQEELGAFVSESRLKKSGGIEELERSRKARDDENLKACFGVI